MFRKRSCLKPKNKVLSREKLYFYFFEYLDKMVLVIGPMHVSSYGDLDGQRYSESSLQSCFNAFIVVIKLVATVTLSLVQ